MKKFFEASELIKITNRLLDGRACEVDLAQFLNEKLECKGIEVYGDINAQDYRKWSTEPFLTNTHTALLINIEEIKPKDCDHLVTVHLGTENSGTWYECRKCDKKLKAKFEVIENE